MESTSLPKLAASMNIYRFVRESLSEQGIPGQVSAGAVRELIELGIIPEQTWREWVSAKKKK